MNASVRSATNTLCAVAATAAVTLGLTTVPPERANAIAARAQHALVQLDVALAATALEIGSATAVAPTAAIEPTAATRAAATTDNPIISIVRFIATIAAIPLLPIWWIAFPITIPIMYSAVNAASPIVPDYGLSNIRNFFTTITYWPLGPLALIQGSLPKSPYDATPSTTAAGRAAASVAARRAITAGPRASAAQSKTTKPASARPARSKAASASRPVAAKSRQSLTDS